MNKLSKTVFKTVNEKLPTIRKLIKEGRKVEANIEIDKINKWLVAYEYEVKLDDKYIVTLAPLLEISDYKKNDSPLCACGAVKRKEFNQCYDCFNERTL